jgi:DNA polymerase
MSDALNQYYLETMGIDSWVLRDKPHVTHDLRHLAEQVSTCTRCPLHATRTKTVFARGNPHAALMVVGEAPGFYEDRQGLPFVGRAGALLTNMLRSIGLGDDDVYIANVLKCRPPNNRNPTADEVAFCGDYLAQQIVSVSPRLILALGRFAGQFVTASTQTLALMRGVRHTYAETPVVVTYHPAYLLRSPADKKQAYQDLWLVQSIIQGQGG